MVVLMYRVETVLTGIGGLPGLSVMYFDASGADAGACTDAVGTFWDAVADALSTSLHYAVQDQVSIISDDTGGLNGVATGTNPSGSGSASDEPLPFATQALIRWTTTTIRNNRHVIGHTYLPGLTQVANDSGQMASADVTVFLGAASDLVNDEDALFGVWSRKVLGTESGEFCRAAGAVVGTKFAVLRSRRD
jgi:hypothetical protein